jgi:DNA-binding PadR family transcriptional regulator
MRDAAFYELIQETSGAIYQAMIEVRRRSGETPPDPPLLLQVRAGRAESPGWYLVQAVEFAPQPLTVELLRVRDIYASERMARALLDLMASEQWLEREGDAYRLTDAGRAVYWHARQRTAQLLAGLELLPASDMAFLMTTLERVIAASLSSPTPPGAWCLAHSRHRAPDASAPPLAVLNQYVADFNAFRDDAHMAAWRPYESSGAAWEAFSFVCSGEATTPADIAAQLAHRGYSPGDYATALVALAERGWLAPTAEGGYSLTEAGQAIRETVERQTDDYFYASWSMLSDGEFTRVRELLVQLQANLLATATTQAV